MDFPKRKRKHSSDSKSPGAFWSVSKIFMLAVFILLFASLFFNFFLVKRLGSHHKVIVVQKPALNHKPALNRRGGLIGGTGLNQVAASNHREQQASATEGASHPWYGLCLKNEVHSIADFHRIVNGDPLLAKHFSAFNWKNASMGHLPRTIWKHVTYRKDGKIGISTRPVMLPKGDGYITDGHDWVRTYCCNDYVLDPWEQRIEMMTRAQAQRLFERTQHKKQISSTPEPSSFLLVAMGISGFGVALFVRKRWKMRSYPHSRDV